MQGCCVVAWRRETLARLIVPGMLAVSTMTCFAQASSGVTGTITDSSGAVVPGAAVEIKNIATGTVVKVVSGSAGEYNVTGLIPGRYTLTVTAAGFSKTVRDQVNVEVSTQATLDISLNTGSNETVVEVTAPLIALNTTQPELGTTIEPAVVNSLPVAITGGRGRQIDSLQFLAPGVSGDTFSHRVNGGADFQSEILYNGIPAPQAETAGFSTLFNPPFELIGQFRLERSTFSAQYGLAQGAVTYQTVSGTNNYHGDAFYINRNEFFDAKGYFNTKTPTDRENNYGFTIGGPASIPHLYNAKDRTFFTFALDFAKQSNSDTRFGTVPTVQQKTGDFTDFVDPSGALIPIFDPATGQQFQYQGRLNVIDPARFSAASKSLLASIPDPDRPGLVNNKNYIPNSYPRVDHNWGFSIDHTLTPTQSIHYSEWRHSFSETVFDIQGNGGVIFPANNILQSAKTQPDLGSVFLLNYVNTLTPRLVYTAGVSWIGEINNQFSLSPKANFAGVVQSPTGAGLMPHITFDGQNAVNSFGVANGETQSINRKLGLSAVNNFLWTKGRHTLNIGGEARRSYQDDNECQQCTGNLGFSQRTTANPNALGTTGNSFASFLLGQADSASRIFANELSLRNLLIAPYIQDDIKFTPKLTVNAGLRWDIMLPFTEKNNQIVFLNQTAQNPLAGNRPGVATQFGPSSGITRADIHFKNFGPRLGLAYAVNDKTVIQAGYNLAFLNGGSFEYGTSKVATSYGNLLQGSFTRNSTGGVTPGYGSYDANPVPAPAKSVVGPALGIGTTIRAFDPKRSGRPPYLQQWNVNIQRQLPWNTFLQVAYVGNRALHLNGQLNPINQQNPSILANGPLLRLRFSNPAEAAQLAAAGFTTPYPNFATDFGDGSTLAQSLTAFPQYSNVFNNFDLSGRSQYNGLQVSVEKRFSNGLSFLTSYTLSRTMSNVDSGFGTFASLPENKFNQAAEYTVSGSDELNNAKISGTYELPLGPGKSFLNNKGITGQIVGGFQLGFILDYETGTPFGISENGNPLGCAGCFNRPNVVASVGRSSNGYTNLKFANGRSTRQVFSTNAFAVTPTDFTLGNAVRNYPELRNPGFYSESLKASKKFALGERVNFILEMNYFNLLNRVRFNGPNTNISDTSNFGTVPANGQQSLTGSPSGARNGQLSGRVTF